MEEGVALRQNIERENERIAIEFNDGWSEMDVDKILANVSDDVVYMVHEKGRVLHGIDEVRRTLNKFMEHWDKVEFDVRQMNVMGPLVTHERTEYYHGKGDHEDWNFWVAALLVIRNGKIEIWRDYAVPGKVQNAGNATDAQYFEESGSD